MTGLAPAGPGKDANMNIHPLALHAIFLLATTATLSGTVMAVRWRLRRSERRPGIDPVVNACVRGGAALVLVLMLGWAAATADTPRLAPESCRQGDRCVAHSCDRKANANEKAQR